MSPSRFLPVLATCALVTGCTIVAGGDSKARGADADSRVSVSLSSDSGLQVSHTDVEGGDQSRAGQPTFAEGPDGSVSMTTRNRAIVMSLRHDSIVVAFSDSIRGRVQQKMRASTDARDTSGSALGEVVGGVVKSAVSGALSEIFDKARGFPVSSLRDVAYDDGAIRFEYRSKPAWTFDSFKIDNEPLLEQFHPADAARFVGAVRARLRRS